ncbi:17437_t:CDS:1, partial [Racocetra persica]
PAITKLEKAIRVKSPLFPISAVIRKCQLWNFGSSAIPDRRCVNRFRCDRRAKGSHSCVYDSLLRIFTGLGV